MLSTNNQSIPILISVIIPVYNTAAYLYDAVTSIMNQSLKEIEIIIIDDGSTDNSLDIMSQLADKDSRISIYSQKNQGQSIARNLGLSKAKGKYIYFMDSDDYLLSETLEFCYNNCSSDDLDFMTFDGSCFSDDNARYDISLSYDRSNCLFENQIYEGVDALEKQIYQKCFTPSPCLLLINTDFLKRNKLLFYEGIIHEDQLFTVQLYLYAKRIAYNQTQYFKRRMRSNSTMTQNYKWKNIEGYLAVTNELLKLKNNVDSQKLKQVINIFLRQMFDAAIWNAYSLPIYQRFKLFFICSKYPYSKYVCNRTKAVLLFKNLLS